MILDINVYASHNLQQKFHIYKTRPIFHHQIITKNFSFLYLDVRVFSHFSYVYLKRSLLIRNAIQLYSIVLLSTKIFLIIRIIRIVVKGRKK